MSEIARIKKTGRIVYPIGPASSTHTYCLFKEENGKSTVQSVRNDNLKNEKQEPQIAKN